MDTPNVAHLDHDLIGRSVIDHEMRERYRVCFLAHTELGIAVQSPDPCSRYFDLTPMALPNDSTRDQAFGYDPRCLLMRHGAHVELRPWF